MAFNSVRTTAKLTMEAQPMKLYRLVDIIGNRKKNIPGIIPMSRSSWYAGISEGRYPAPIKLSERSSAWRSTDIDALIDRLSAGQ